MKEQYNFLPKSTQTAMCRQWKYAIYRAFSEEEIHAAFKSTNPTVEWDAHDTKAANGEPEYKVWSYNKESFEKVLAQAQALKKQILQSKPSFTSTPHISKRTPPK